MKKIITILSVSLFALVFVTSVSAATPDWNLKGIYTIAFTCTAGCGGTYTHTMTISVMSMTNGAFSGTGVYNADSSYTWNVTGTVDGSNLSFAVDYTGSNPNYAVNAAGTINSSGMLSGTATSNSGQSFTWVNTTGKADMQPVAEITSPTEEQDVMGTLNLTATYTDDNPAGVQWAVREGTCTANLNTRAGNVDGFSTPYSWVTTGMVTQFSSTIDVSAWSTGDYCFVFNPGESSLERDIRLTRWFDIIADTDKDGIGDEADNCPLVANADQSNNDIDTMGDACDPDDDNDGVLDGPDNCQFVANPYQEDWDKDGVGNACDSDRLTLAGFYQPVDMGDVFNTVKGGSTVPLKFEIFYGTTELTDTSYVKSLVSVPTACETGAATADVEITATGETSLRYDTTAGQFIYNWKTPKNPNLCYRVTMTTIDGSTLFANFKLK